MGSHLSIVLQPNDGVAWETRALFAVGASVGHVPANDSGTRAWSEATFNLEMVA